MSTESIQTLPGMGWEGLCCLIHGYESVGATPQAVQALVRMCETEQARDLPGALDALMQRLNRYAGSHDEAHAALTALRGTAIPPAIDDTDALGISPASGAFVLDQLLRHAFLTKREYIDLIESLASGPGTDTSYPVSALHLLRDRGHRKLMEMCCFLSEDTGIPLIPLSAFTTNPEATSLLPRDFSRRRGCTAFALLDRDLLVAVLNPYNTDLVQSAQERSGRCCHPFLVMPHEYDQWMDQVPPEVWAKADPH